MAGNEINGYPALVSNQVRSTLTKGGTGGNTGLSEVFFGDFSQLLIGLWSGLDVLVDPYTGGNSGAVRIVTLQDVGFAVRHPEAFVYANDLKTS